MKKPAVLFFFWLLGIVGLASAQNRPVGGAFAAVPIPGQPAAPVTPTPTAPPSPGVARPPTPQAPGAKPEEQLRIVADPATNSLIIYGTTQEFQNVRNILRELDAIPRQVLIEALILQVDLKDTEDFGIDYQVLTKSRTIFGKTFGSSAALVTLGKLLPSAPFFSGINGLSAIVGNDTVSALIRAAATDSRIKLISAPSVLASDNRPARIQVGSEEPIATSSTSQPGGTTGFNVTTNQIQYRNTGRILTIIPQVNAQGLVNLQIKAEVSARGDDVKIGTESFPAFNTQDAETTAIVHDGETLVIGGLIGERKSKGRSGIPYLMDLPIVGRFFGTTSEATDRTELIMLITPRVMRNRDESRGASEEFKNKLSTVRNELEKMQRDRERDLEKLKSQTREQPKPAEPPVPPAEPARPPVSAPTRPGAYFSPITSPAIAQPDVPLVESAVSNDEMLPVMKSQDGLELLLADIETAREPTKNEKSPLAPDAVASSPKARGTAQPVRFETEGAASPAKKSAQRWVVQVAALAQAKDADLLCKRLRDKGYDAQVSAADVAGRTWHRVQVGQLTTRQEAFELQKNLKTSEKMEQAFVASR